MDKVGKNLARIVCRSASSPVKAITLEAANLARFSDGSCTCSLGDTSVLVTAVSHESQKPAGSFVPLTVEYRQKAAAAGRIPMTHLRRDMGATEKEILTGRMIDRSIRPLFAKSFKNDTQIICNLMAVDGNNDPDVLAINGASASLSISDIPWFGPIGAVRMGLVGKKLVVNPSRREQENSRLNLVLSANHHGNVMMMDGYCKEPVLVDDLMRAINHGVKECRAIVGSILSLQKAIGKPKRKLDASNLPSEEQKKFAISFGQEKIKDVLSDPTLDKIGRDNILTQIRNETIDALKEAFPDTDSSILGEVFNHAVKYTYKQVLATTKIRCDGRQFHELRPISCSVDLYKPLHGSAIFQRGQTQVFCSTTFDSPDAAFRTDTMTLLMSGVKEKNFMLHYEFPPFATNDIGKFGVFGRREIGHGALAERGIRPVVPENNDMTIRLNCEVLESNGSSSMASVCAGSLSLMDAGVGIEEHVAGIAMGLMSDFSEKSDTNEQTATDYHLLTDILGFEDYIGDMDFKIAGTKSAVTALQLDVKPMIGVPTSLIHEALDGAQKACIEIIDKMSAAIGEPRKEKKDNHPIIKTIHVPPHEESKFVGFGGKNLKKLTAEIGVRISAYSPIVQNGQITGELPGDNYAIFAPNKEAMQEAEEFIETLLVKEPKLEFNGIYTATIQEIRPNGVMVTLYPGMRPTLLPLSQLDVRSVTHPSALNIEVGQQIQVKYFDRDPSSGQMRLSHKCLQMSSTPRVRQMPIK